MKISGKTKKMAVIAMLGLFVSYSQAITVYFTCGYGTAHVDAVVSTCGCVYGNLCQPSNGWIQIDPHDQCGDIFSGNATNCVDQVNPGPEGHYITSCGKTFNWGAFIAAYSIFSITGTQSISTILAELAQNLSGAAYIQAVGDLLWDCDYVTCATNLGDPYPDYAVPVLSGNCKG